MAALLDVLVNLLRFVRNARVRMLGRPPGFVWIDVSGNVPEFETRPGFLRRRLSPGPTEPAPSLEGIRNKLDRITADGRPQGVVLRVRNLGAGWATLEELRRELERFRGRGGRVVVYLVEADTPAYYLACAADEVYATPQSTFAAVGLRARVDFLGDALDRVGLDAEVFAVSPYKSAYDRFVREDFSDEAREQVERLLNRRFDTFLQAVAHGRDLTLEEAREKIDGAPYAAPAAVEAGLLDGAIYEDQMPERLGRDGGRAELSEWGRAVKSLKMPYRRTRQRVVGMVGVTGAITRGKSRRLPIPVPLLGREQAGGLGRRAVYVG